MSPHNVVLEHYYRDLKRKIFFFIHLLNLGGHLKRDQAENSLTAGLRVEKQF